MKRSNYNFSVKLDEDKSIAFNSFTTDLSLVNERFDFLLNNIEDIVYDDLNGEDKAIFDKMKEAGYIVDDATEELDLLKIKYNKSKYGEKKCTWSCYSTNHEL